MGVKDYELDEDYGRRNRRRYRDDRDYDDDRGYGRQGGGWRDDDREGPRKERLSKREPVRIAGAIATLISAAALVLFGVEVETEQQNQIREIVLLAIPIIAPMIAGFEVARSKVDSPATVERRIREERDR